MRRGVRGEPNPGENSKAQLEEFKRLEDEGYLYYLDETDFCLIPSVPLWMAKHWRILNS